MNTTSQVKPLPEGRMLLSSLMEFWNLIEPLLEAARARNICEIGTGKGEFTAALLDYCRRNSGHYTGIDPRADAARPDGGASPFAQMIAQPSLAALPELAAQDVYFLDGDHNYHTVRNELRLILESPARWPLVVLHDVCWPWGRRDQYCDPETIPEAARHPSTASLGVVPGRNEPGPAGFSGAGSEYGYAAACHEGGPRNGVRAAVEDFLREPAGRQWRLLVVPVVFGLGILYAPEKTSDETRRELEHLEKSVAPLRALLEIMERNRVDLFLAYLRHIAGLESAESAYQKLNAAYERLDAHTRELQGKYEELFARYGELRAHADKLQAAYEELRRGPAAVIKGR